MKTISKKFLVAITLLTFLMTSLLTPAFAAPSTVANLSFSGNTINDSAGKTWSTNGSVTVAGSKATFATGYLSTPGVAEYDLSSNQDFYLKFKSINITSIASTDQALAFRSNSFTVVHDGPTLALKVYGGSKYSFTNFSLAGSTDYDVVISREGSSLKLFINDTEVETQTINDSFQNFNGADLTVGMFQGSVNGFTFVTGDHYVATSIGGNPPDSNPTATITGASFSSSYSSITFSNVSINNSAALTSTGSSTLTIEDNRGSGSGWAVKLKISDFISSDIFDRSNGATGTFRVKFPANSVEATVGAANLIAGQAIDPTYGPKPTTSLTLSSAAQTMIDSSPGYGMGKYTVPVSFTINVPKTVTIDSKSNATGTLNTGDAIGLAAGTYSSTFTFINTIGL